MPPPIPKLDLSLAASASANNDARFQTGAKSFGGKPGLFGEIGQQVIIGVAVAVALMFIIPRLKKS